MRATSYLKNGHQQGNSSSGMLNSTQHAVTAACDTDLEQTWRSDRAVPWPGSPWPGQSCSAWSECVLVSWSQWRPSAQTSAAVDTTRCPLQINKCTEMYDFMATSTQLQLYHTFKIVILSYKLICMTKYITLC